MKTAVFSTKPHDREFLLKANADHDHDLVFFEARLKAATAPLAHDFPAVSIFVNDVVDREVLQILHQGGTRMLALRSAGFNHVDIPEATGLGMTVARVPAYSPHAVAEHTVGLILALNRRIHRAFNRVREGNFALDGLLGFDLHGKTAGVVGTGKIGALVARILAGFGCRLLVHDVRQNPACLALGAQYVELEELFSASDIVTLHCPLTPETHHMIDDGSLPRMKDGVMIINTSRGGLVDTHAVIQGLKSGKIGYLGLDVYEEETELFFEDLSHTVIQDDVFSRLLTFPNVLITGHQAFFTREAVENIAATTLANIAAYEAGKVQNEVRA
jgi:D-lactate dehydrogenase